MEVGVDLDNLTEAVLFKAIRKHFLLPAEDWEARAREVHGHLRCNSCLLPGHRLPLLPKPVSLVGQQLLEPIPRGRQR